MTLLELLLAIALLLAVGGLVLPALFDRLTERAFESSAEIVRSQLLLARAHAQATGEPIEVLFKTDPPGVVARRFDVGLIDLDSTGDDPGADILPDEPFEAASASDEQEPDTLRIPEPWAERPLADGVWISDQSGLVEDGSGGAMAMNAGLAAEDDRDAMQEDETLRTLRLALFMPDGSAVLSEPVWIRDEHGRRGRLTINQWTGLASFERVMATLPEPEEDEEPEPEEPDEDLERLEREFAEPEATEPDEEVEGES